MRAIDAGDARTRKAQQRADDAAIDAALGAMRMDDVRPQRADLAEEAQQRDDVGRRYLPAHRHAVQAERQMRLDLGEELRFACPAGRGIADDADQVSRRRLRPDEVAHMTEDAADRRAEAMHDPQRRVASGCRGVAPGHFVRTTARGY